MVEVAGDGGLLLLKLTQAPRARGSKSDIIFMKRIEQIPYRR